MTVSELVEELQRRYHPRDQVRVMGCTSRCWSDWECWFSDKIIFDKDESDGAALIEGEIYG